MWDLWRVLPTGPSNAWRLGGVWVETAHKAMSDDYVVNTCISVLQQLTGLWCILQLDGRNHMYVICWSNFVSCVFLASVSRTKIMAEHVYIMTKSPA